MENAKKTVYMDSWPLYACVYYLHEQQDGWELGQISSNPYDLTLQTE